MTNTDIRAWTRAELEEIVGWDKPEGTRTMFRVRVSPKLLLLLMEYQTAHRNERCELIGVSGDPLDVELKFYFRDAVEDDPEMIPDFEEKA